MGLSVLHKIVKMRCLIGITEHFVFACSKGIALAYLLSLLSVASTSGASGLGHFNLNQFEALIWSHDTHHNDIQHNNSEHEALTCDTQYN